MASVLSVPVMAGHNIETRPEISKCKATHILQQNAKLFQHQIENYFNPLNAELNPIYHLLALLGGATIVVVSRLRVN